jgi:hypothetical protein
MTNFIVDENETILVEFANQPGMEEVGISLTSGAELAKQSALAINNAMNTIRNMAYRVVTTMKSLPEQPTQIEVQFGIKLNLEGSAVVAKASGESTITVKLSWDQQKKSDQ